MVTASMCSLGPSHPASRVRGPPGHGKNILFLGHIWEQREGHPSCLSGRIPPTAFRRVWTLKRTQ